MNQPAAMTATAKPAKAKRRIPKAGRVLGFLVVVAVAAPFFLFRKTVKTVSQNQFETVPETVSKPQESAEKTVLAPKKGDRFTDEDGNELIVQRVGGRKKKSEKPAGGNAQAS